MTAPLFRDPAHDGATDPVLVQHRGDGTWWMLYTQRRPDGRTQTPPESTHADTEVRVGPMDTLAERRSSIQAARLAVVDGHLVCDRDRSVTLRLPTQPPTRLPTQPPTRLPTQPPDQPVRRTTETRTPT